MTPSDMAQILITGGAGFIGSNLAHRLLTAGHEVAILDDLSRAGASLNVGWLRKTHGAGTFRLLADSVANFPAVQRAVAGAEVIYHLAGQVAVTRSVESPREDFEANALGTFNVLEAARLGGRQSMVIFSSTNKVYGSLEGLGVVEEPTRYRFADLPEGVPESQPLDFHSPYACSNGAADQYCRDYARVYGLPTVVFRQSCIYGYRQFGMEDQGWVAWLILAALQNRPITIYGDGKQVRDLLFVDDLLDAYEAAVDHIDHAAGQIYNVGGGPAQTLSVWTEFGPRLEDLLGRPLPVRYQPPRPGDQRVFISDIRKAERDLGWRPRVAVTDGLGRLYRWLEEHQHLFAP